VLLLCWKHRGPCIIRNLDPSSEVCLREWEPLLSLIDFISCICFILLLFRPFALSSSYNLSSDATVGVKWLFDLSFEKNTVQLILWGSLNVVFSKYNCNFRSQVLVVQEKCGIFRGTGIWKLPTGAVDEVGSWFNFFPSQI